MSKINAIVEKWEDYDGFVEKFKPKKTTDDCYTPPEIYDAVLGWVDAEIAPLEGLTVRRPFKPGGNYKAEAEGYGPKDVVVDNPPFSILAEIVKYYLAKNIRFFLFAPSLTLFGGARFAGVTAVVAHAEIIYENGAVVRTSFLTNMEGKHKIIVAGGLCRMLTDLSARLKAVKNPPKTTVAKHYPMEMMSAANLGRLCVRGIEMKVPMHEAAFVRRLDNQGQSAIFGGGFLISERAAAERAAAERAAAERAAVERIELSQAERELCRRLCYADGNNPNFKSLF